MTILNELISQSVLDQYSALDTAIGNLEQMIKLQPPIAFTGVDRSTYLRECRTVIAGAGRQNGKGYWIATHADSTSMILCMNSHVRDSYRAKFEDLGIKKGQRSSIVILAELENIYAEKTIVKKVFVDDAYYVFSKIDRNKFYRRLEHRCSEETIFYLIG